MEADHDWREPVTFRDSLGSAWLDWAVAATAIGTAGVLSEGMLEALFTFALSASFGMLGPRLLVWFVECARSTDGD